MRSFLLIVSAFLVISFSGVPSGEKGETKLSSTFSINDGDEEYTYKDVYINGIHYIYVYLGDILIDVYEVEE